MFSDKPDPAFPPSEFVDSSPLLGDGPALRQRALSGEGYLFIKGLLPAADLVKVRQDILDVVDKHGWIDRNRPLMEGRMDVPAINRTPVEDMRTDIGVSLAIYQDVQRLLSVHQFPHHPRLIGLFETLFGGSVLVHPRHIVRMVTPHHTVVPTPPHQDHPLIQGSKLTWTSWFPIGPCPRNLGGLTVLRGSHHLGCLPIQEAEGAGRIASILCPGEDHSWVEGDFAAGDVLVFTSTTVHRALPCAYRDRMRLSFDVRYQPVSEPVEARSLLPHVPLNWEEIYAGWGDAPEAQAFKYYWQQAEPSLVPWDDTLRDYGRRIC